MRGCWPGDLWHRVRGPKWGPAARAGVGWQKGFRSHLVAHTLTLASAPMLGLKPPAARPSLPVLQLWSLV